MGFKTEVEKAVAAMERMRPSEEEMSREPGGEGAPTAADDWLCVMAALAFARNAAPVMEGMCLVSDELVRQGRLALPSGTNKARAALPAVLAQFGIASA